MQGSCALDRLGGDNGGCPETPGSMLDSVGKVERGMEDVGFILLFFCAYIALLHEHCGLESGILL